MNPLSESTPLAVVGMACRLPGAADLDHLWRLLTGGGCALREVPPDQFDRDLYFDPCKGVPRKSYTLLAGLVPPEPFDERCCPRPKHWEAAAEPGHLLFCQVAAEACRHAGLDPFDLPRRDVGVYVGGNTFGLRGIERSVATLIEEAAAALRGGDEFRRLPAAVREAVACGVIQAVRGRRGHAEDDLPAGSHAAAALVADALGLEGPAIVMDAACASSLYVLATAAAALRRGRVTMALVGAGSAFIPDNLVYFSHVQAVSATGCRPFSAAADGTVSSAGYVAILLKTLPRAVQDGDRILSVIRGIGLSADGRGKALWAPMPQGQIAAIRRAYGDTRQLQRMQYLEAHATGTVLGDKVEMAALRSVLGEALPGRRKIPIGSIKANIGHTLEVAGLASLIKTVLAMQHRTIPQQIAAWPLNAETDWERLPFVVPDQNVSWEAADDGGPRQAGVSAFGIGGLNSHLVLEEFQPEAGGTAWAPLPGAATALGSSPSGLSTARDDDAAVAVLGIGCVFPGAVDITAFWDLLQSGHDPRGEPPDPRWPGAGLAGSLPTRRGGYVTEFRYDWQRHRIPPKQIAQADPLQYLMLEAAEAALADGGYAPGSDKFAAARERMGTFAAVKFPTDFWNRFRTALRLPEFQRDLAAKLREQGLADECAAAVCSQFGVALDQLMPSFQDETGSFIPSTFASRLTKALNLNGGAVAISAGWCSSSAALMCAADALWTGDCDLALCVAGQRELDRVAYSELHRRGLLAADGTRHPFDAAAAGMLPAEGAGVLLLKRLADARRDGDRIRGILRGIAGAKAPTVAEAALQAIRQAWTDAEVRSEEVHVVETAGVGDPQQDRELLQCLLRAFDEGYRLQPALLGSLTGQLGHLQGAAGMAAMIKTLLAFEHGRLPPCRELQQPSAALQGFPRTLRLVTETTPLASPAYPDRMLAAVVDCDPDGQAFQATLERVPPPGRPGAAAPLIRAGSDAPVRGDSGQLLRAQLEGIRITGISAAVPAQTATVEDLAAVFGRQEAERLSALTGIAQRRIAGKLCTSDLCLRSARVLLAESGVAPAEIQVLVLVTQTPDYLSPATACSLHASLGLPKSCGVLDVNLGCSGYVYGLWLAGSLMSAGKLRHGLLLVGDTTSRMISPQDKNVAALFGDAGSATLLEFKRDHPPMTFCLGTDGRGFSCLINPAGGFRQPRDGTTAVRFQRKDGQIRSEEDLYMNGSEVFAFTIREVPPLIRAALEFANWRVEEVERFVFHQANRYMLDYLVKRSGLPAERVPLSLARYGNTSSATIPLTLVEHFADVSQRRTGKFLLAGFGGGLSWGSAACELDNPWIPAVQVLPDPDAGGRP